MSKKLIPISQPMSLEQHREITDKASDIQIELALQHVFFLADRITDYIKKSRSYKDGLTDDFKKQIDGLAQSFDSILGQLLEMRNFIHEQTGASTFVEDNGETIVAILERARDIHWFHERVMTVLKKYGNISSSQVLLPASGKQLSDVSPDFDFIDTWYQLFCNALHMIKAAAQSSFFTNGASRYAHKIPEALLYQYNTLDCGGNGPRTIPFGGGVSLSVLGGFDDYKSTLSAWLSDSPDLFPDVPEYRGMVYGGISALIGVHDVLEKNQCLLSPALPQIDYKK